MAQIRLKGRGKLRNANEILLSEFVAGYDRGPATRAVVRLGIALSHFGAFLRRPPLVGDLLSPTLQGFYDWLIDGGYSAATADSYARSFRAAGQLAVAAGLLAELPHVRQHPILTHDHDGRRFVDRLNRIFASARTMPGLIGGVPAGKWFSAFLLTVLDTRAEGNPLLSLGPEGCDLKAGTLRVGPFVHPLRPRTVQAIKALGNGKRKRLFPLDFDRSMLSYRSKQIVYRAGLGPRQPGLFSWLRSSIAEHPDAADKLDLESAFVPRERPPATGQGRRPTRMYRRPPAEAAFPVGFGPSHAKGKKPAKGPEVFRIAASPDRGRRTLRRFFEEEYIPRKLDGRSPNTATSYRTTINQLEAFACCEVLLDVSDESIEKFLAFLRKRGQAAHTRHKARRQLVAILNFAWRKRFLDVPPRIEEVATPKLEPTAWTMLEAWRLIAAADVQAGEVSGVPAGLWWGCLLRVALDSGLRRGALLQLRVGDLDLVEGWVTARHETQKTRATQTVGLHPETCDYLRPLVALLRGPEALLFPFPFKGSHPFNRRLRKILTAAGLAAGKSDMMHKIRRTVACAAYRAAGEQAAVALMGHSGPSVLRNHYLSPKHISRPGSRIVDLMERPKAAAAGSTEPATAKRPGGRRR